MKYKKGEGRRIEDDVKGQKNPHLYLVLLIPPQIQELNLNFGLKIGF